MKKINRFLESIYSRGIIYIPSIFLAILSMKFLYTFWFDTNSELVNEALVDTMKICSTFSALAFYAGYMTTKEHKKPIFYINGERFFHAVAILFSVEILLKMFGFLSVNIHDALFLVCAQNGIKTIAVIFLLYSIGLMCAGLLSLLKVMHMDFKQRVHL